MRRSARLVRFVVALVSIAALVALVTTAASAVAEQRSPALVARESSALVAQRSFAPGSWRTLLATKAGKPLVVHFWGLTCGPCIVELPEWAKLEKAAPHASFVYVQADPVPVKGGDQTLRKAGLGRAESWTFAAGANDDRLRYEVDPRWRGELPKTVLVAADGTVTPLRDGTDFTRIRAWLHAQRD